MGLIISGTLSRGIFHAKTMNAFLKGFIVNSFVFDETVDAKRDRESNYKETIEIDSVNIGIMDSIPVAKDCLKKVLVRCHAELDFYSRNIRSGGAKK